MNRPASEESYLANATASPPPSTVSFGIVLSALGKRGKYPACVQTVRRRVSASAPQLRYWHYVGDRTATFLSSRGYSHMDYKDMFYRRRPGIEKWIVSIAAVRRKNAFA